MKLKNERIIENLLIEISYKFKQKERTANSAFAKPGFLSTFERFWFYVTFGFAEAFRLKSPASQMRKPLAEIACSSQKQSSTSK
jgi:hypothetical protein